MSNANNSLFFSLYEAAKAGEKEKLLQHFIPVFDFEFTRFRTALTVAKERVYSNDPQLAQLIVLGNQRLEQLLPAMASCSVLLASYPQQEDVVDLSKKVSIIDSEWVSWGLAK